MKLPIQRICFSIAVLAQFTAFLVIPVLGASVFLSPDETATAVSARAFGQHATMRIEDSILRDAPWLHPRSFVTQGEAMVPVGFLGLPAILGALWRILGDWVLVLFTPLLVLSVIFPLWKWCARFGVFAQMSAVFVWLSYPGVIVYANRGLFPNLVNVCFMVWSVYAMGRSHDGKRRPLWLVGSGLAFGLATIIRPVELLWMIPWVAFAATDWGRRLPSWRNLRWNGLLWLLGIMPCVLLLLFVNWQAYGSPWTIGYWLRDSAGGRIEVLTTMSPPIVRWPFGLHPKNVWFNVQAYLFGYLGPWFAVFCFGAALLWRQQVMRRFVVVGAWTLAVLAMMYGEAIYQDHVGVNVISIGNSYIRYLLPLAPLIALASAVCVERLLRDVSRLRSIVAITAVVMLVVLGNWMALSRDQEGVLSSSVEVSRYQIIRQTTREAFGENPIILSERSDKIFFPQFRAASTPPQFEKMFIVDLVEHTSTTVALFSSVLDSAHVVPWTNAGLSLRPVFQVQQQMMYAITASSTRP